MSDWNEEDKKWAKEVLTCRQVVAEINNFGVNMNQKLKIIELLALELEDREVSVGIAKMVKEALELIETGAKQNNKGRILV